MRQQNLLQDTGAMGSSSSFSFNELYHFSQAWDFPQYRQEELKSDFPKLLRP